jgi:hypothetical protein
MKTINNSAKNNRVFDKLPPDCDTFTFMKDVFSNVFNHQVIFRASQV